MTFRHGHAGTRRTPTYLSWMNMHDRCRNPNARSYPRYGGRGIAVCEQWQHFENFLADMGIRPKGKTLDRINVNGDYEPSNCRWATHAEQCRNMVHSRFLTLNGRSQCVTDWARAAGISQALLWYRLSRGWPDSELLRPPRPTGIKNV